MRYAVITLDFKRAKFIQTVLQNSLKGHAVLFWSSFGLTRSRDANSPNLNFDPLWNISGRACVSRLSH